LLVYSLLRHYKCTVQKTKQNSAFSELLNDTLLQQHGALHILDSLYHRILDEVFPNKRTEQDDDITYPPLLPYLTPLYMFLRGNRKNKIYKQKAGVLQQHHVQYCNSDKEVEAGEWVSC